MAKGEIGFIGLGRMGGPMARNLTRAGYALHVFDVSEAAARAVAAAGAAVVTHPAPRAVAAMSIEARIVGVLHDSFGENADRVVVPAEVRGAPAEPDDRVRVVRIGLVRHVRRSELRFALATHVHGERRRDERFPKERNCLDGRRLRRGSRRAARAQKKNQGDSHGFDDYKQSSDPPIDVPSPRLLAGRGNGEE